MRRQPDSPVQPDRSLLLAGVTLADGTRADVAVEGTRIAAVAPPGTAPPAGERFELDGYLLLPAPAEPHAHLDKAFTAGQVPNHTGDLDGAADAWLGYRPTVSHADLVHRATGAALAQLGSGATAIRTHVEIGTDIGLSSLDALLEVRRALRSRVDLQLVAMPRSPLTGPDGGDNRALLREAMLAGADVVGGCPYRDPDPAAAHEVCLDLAAELGRPLDLHTDETLDPEVLWLPHLAGLVRARGFTNGVAASHCVSLGVQPSDVAARIAAEVAAAGIAVICCPLTNLFLQARRLTAPPRGLTALHALLAAGAEIAGGGDNLRDPFNPVGRADPLEVASLLVLAGHLDPRRAFQAVSAGARAVMGLPEVRVAPGFPAELLAIRAESIEEAVASASPERVVIHRGRPVSRTTLAREMWPGSEAPSPWPRT
jgi:cytosine/creatinine deaminase